jgi:hypothetical protein
MAARSLPHIVFRAEAPPRVSLPRMDIAAFVGFAASGPLNTPVLVEDVARLRDLFGDPATLAWDPETESWQTTCLAPAVADFFAQGGRRCWVVRVAANASERRFPLPGLLKVEPAGGFSAAVARARSRGSWPDRLQVRAGLLSQTLGFEPQAAAPGRSLAGRFRAASRAALQPGDLLRLSFEGGALCYARIDTASEPAGTARWVQVSATARWFQPLQASDLPITGRLTTVRYAGSSLDELPETFAGVTLSRQLVAAPLNLAPEPGDWLALENTGGRAWLLASERVSGGVRVLAGWRELTAGPAAGLRRVERVSMALSAQEEEGRARGRVSHQIEDLAFSAPHPRYWGSLPVDEELFQRSDGLPKPEQRRTAQPLWDEVSQAPRYPLAGLNDQDGFYLPLGLEAAPAAWRAALPDPRPALVRDGLAPAPGQSWAAFLQQVYLDPLLQREGQGGLLASAFDLRFIREQALLGMHSLLPLDEISMLALPDAAQRGWQFAGHINHTIFATRPAAPPEACPGHTLFRPLAPPTRPTPPPPEELIATTNDEWRLSPPALYDPTGLLAVQQKAAEFASARADFVVIIGLPAHYREREAVEHIRLLKERLGDDAVASAASYVSVVHPWLRTRSAQGGLLQTGAEGAVCGLMAKRSLSRGAWTAAANQAVRGVMALTPLLSAGQYQSLYAGGVNVIQQEARGFVLWGDATLSENPDDQALTTRRLLILLRRIALRDGQSFVFEPNSPAYRRQVAVGMERMLTALFERGAFAGSSPSDAYRVVIDDTVNSRESIEQGRLVVELKVAPARPLEFITVRLIETRAGTLVVQEI